MTVKIARNGDVELAYETFGEEGGEPLLLIMGWGTRCCSGRTRSARRSPAAGFHVGPLRQPRLRPVDVLRRSARQRRSAEVVAGAVRPGRAALLRGGIRRGRHGGHGRARLELRARRRRSMGSAIGQMLAVGTRSGCAA